MSDLFVRMEDLARWWEKELVSTTDEIAAKLQLLCSKYNGNLISTRAHEMPQDVLATLQLCEKCWFEKHPDGGVLHFRSTD
ncbi:MAG TPA: hypothetical protein VJZ94_01930 [Candidatus Paceibacterota bacterium]|nr:hypothetical protein [Candidatus Paceibacterota bacterium]